MEETPLLGEQNGEGTSRDDGFRISNLRDRRTRTVMAILLGSTLGTAGIGFFHLGATRLVEAVLCRQYYDELGEKLSDGPIDEHLCKVDAIQEQMAYIFGLYFAIRAIVALCVAFPWAMAADRMGRRPVMIFAILGLILDMVLFALICYFSDAVPVKLVVLTPLVTIFGGANPTIVAVILSTCADTVPESSRSTVFLYAHVSGMFGGLISPALAGVLMDRTGLWPVIFTANGLFVACLCVYAFLVPETLKKTSHSKGQNHHVLPESNSQQNESYWARLKSQLGSLLAHFKESLSLLKSASLIVLVLIQITNFPVTQSTGQFMNQFASKRYDISIAQTGYLGSIYGIAHVVVAIVIVPTLSTWLLKSPFFTADPTAIQTEALPQPTSSSSSLTVTSMPLEEPDQHKQKHDHRFRDLILARGSYLFLVVAFVLMGAAPTLTAFVIGLLVLSLGSAFNSLTRAIASVYVDERHHTRLFSLLGITEELGMIFAQPFLAELFAIGMRMNKRQDGMPWIGLPYFGIAILCVLGVIMLLFVRLPPKAGLEEEPLLAGDNASEDTV